MQLMVLTSVFQLEVLKMMHLWTITNMTKNGEKYLHHIKNILKVKLFIRYSFTKLFTVIIWTIFIFILFLYFVAINNANASNNRSESAVIEYSVVKDDVLIDIKVTKKLYSDTYMVYGIDDNMQRYEMTLTSNGVSTILDGDILVTSTDNVEVHFTSYILLFQLNIITFIIR